jgi:hypothetical protein
VPKGFTIHHREPRSLGGKTTRENISIVPEQAHEDWTTLFDSHPATEVATLFSNYWEMFGGQSVLIFELRQRGLAILKELEDIDLCDGRIFTEGELNKKRNIFNRNKNWIRKALAWKRLFGGMSLADIVSEINDIWIDPKYRLVIDVHAVLIRKS